MLRAHRLVACLTAASLLAAAGTSAAIGAERPAPVRGDAQREADRCDRVLDLIAKLTRGKEHLENKIARLKEKIASGELCPEELARARALLEKLEHRLAHVTALIERLKEKASEVCRDGDRLSVPADADD
jgi:anti-sigma28 factor (negative regulator of flagellin synthesis)